MAAAATADGPGRPRDPRQALAARQSMPDPALRTAAAAAGLVRTVIGMWLAGSTPPLKAAAASARPPRASHAVARVHGRAEP